jgi:transcriptional regulator with XRE-family HTH domain
MGRRRLSEADLRFREEVAKKFNAARLSRRLNQSEAARELGITRQAFSQYLLRKATPQAEILARACAKWTLKLRYRDRDFTGGAFGVEPAAELEPHQDGLQLALFDEPQRFENDQLEVVLERAQKTTLQVTIRMKKATESPEAAAKAG